MMHDIQIAFGIRPHLVSTHEITRVTGLVPEYAYDKWEKDFNKKVPKTSLWSIHSDPSAGSVEIHWNNLYNKIETNMPYLLNLAKSSDMKFTIIIDASDRLPSVIIPVRMSETVALLSTIIDTDYYQ